MCEPRHACEWAGIEPCSLVLQNKWGGQEEVPLFPCARTPALSKALDIRATQPTQYLSLPRWYLFVERRDRLLAEGHADLEVKEG